MITPPVIMSSPHHDTTTPHSRSHDLEEQEQEEQGQEQGTTTTTTTTTTLRRLSRNPSSPATLPPLISNNTTPNSARSGQSILLRNPSRAEHSASVTSFTRTMLRTRMNHLRLRNMQQRQQFSSAAREFQRELDTANSNLRALLDDPIPPVISPSVISSPLPSIWTANEATSETEPSRRKKRRLDKDDQPPEYNGFSYGYFGQVVPGQLRMEIVSCDGGLFESDSNRHAAENVLKDDYSVYCTKANRCNLILRHQGATPFCLDQLIIKAPVEGYTAPIQEGMVFVSMTSDGLLARTARYQIQYSSPKRSGRRSSESSRSLPPILSIHHHGDNSIIHYSRHRNYDKDEDDDDREAQIPSDFNVINSANFSVTTECSDDDDEEEEDYEVPPPFHRRRAAVRPSSRVGEGTDDDDEMQRLEWHLRRPHRESFRRETPSQITLADAVEASQIATQEAMKAVGGEYLAPHARFFIEKDKSKCTIKFDPPISGRFILLKMWSPRRETFKNIDIQSIVAKGYAGPRLFPAQKLL